MLYNRCETFFLTFIGVLRTLAASPIMEISRKKQKGFKTRFSVKPSSGKPDYRFFSALTKFK